MNKKEIKTVKTNMDMIEVQLNKHEEWELENGVYIYDLFLENNVVKVYIYDDEKILQHKFDIAAECFFNVEFALKNMINEMYENKINYLQKFINGSKSFYARKVKSMANWTAKGKADKVEEIQKDMINRFKDARFAKIEVARHKEFVQDFYGCLNVLCPDWKVLDIKEKVFERLDDYENIIEGNVSVSRVKNELIVYQMIDNQIVSEIEMEINTYSKVDDVFKYVLAQLKKKVA